MRKVCAGEGGDVTMSPVSRASVPADHMQVVPLKLKPINPRFAIRCHQAAAGYSLMPVDTTGLFPTTPVVSSPMLRAPLLGLVALVVVPALAAQVPLGTGWHRQDEWHYLGYEDWSLDTLPNLNITDHLVFETVHSLLQHWPNTRMRNGKRSVRLSGFSSNTCSYFPSGHNIVPGSIPTGTLLYHGSTSKDLPPGPEWVAIDPEHSYLFCRDSPGHFQQGCWHLTLATTRPLKIIYFDGSSAAKLPYGSMDTQDLIAWGGPGRHGANDERQRIEDLCQWGKNFGVDGFVR